uniref:Uncharacterized protein n=1 Tax=Rhizophora mucronata TaxID=61149 RepID=A0A2P2N0Q7_RHIMU
MRYNNKKGKLDKKKTENDNSRCTREAQVLISLQFGGKIFYTSFDGLIVDG